MAYYTCLICGTVKYIRPSDLADGYGKYCSRRCCGIAQRRNPIESNGRRPRVTNGQQLKSILIVEKVLGRSLKTKSLGNGNGEIVHHINRDNTDNQNANLLVCTQSYHVGLHNKMRVKEGPWKQQAGN